MSVPRCLFLYAVEAVKQLGSQAARCPTKIILKSASAPKTGCLDIQPGMRLPWCCRLVGFSMTTRTAVWSLGMDRSPELSHTRAVEVSCFSNREKDKCSVNPGQCA